MKKKEKIALITILICLIVVFSMFIFLNTFYKNNVCFNEECYQVEIADTKDERTGGLMFRENLDKDKGMLFVFEDEDIYLFHMKNTLIPLDIIWLNSEKEVVHIESALPCEKDCPLINPGKKALYVLELNSGVSEIIGLEEGDKAKFHI